MPGATKVGRFRCPGCSGDMEYDPETGGMKCRFCGHTEAISAPQAALGNGHSLEEELAQTGGRPAKPLSAQALQVSCDGCGSIVAFEPPEVAGACPFCGAVIVAE